MNCLRLFLTSWLLIISAVATSAQEKPVIPLPSDPDAAVIIMDRKGGDIGPGKGGMRVEPILLIRANGKVTVSDPYSNNGIKEGVLSSDEIQDVLRFAITEQEFFSFNASEVKRAISAEIAKTGFGFGVGGAPDTVVHIRTADKDYEASYNDLAFWAERYPGIKALGQLRAIELRLTKITEDVRGRK